nr:hypothetical protein [Tanacetum cinerariifolium]
EEQAAKAQSWKFPVCYDDDDDEEGYNSLNDNIIFELPSYSAVIPTEPIDSLSMGDQHLDTIPAMESDEVIKSCVENLVPNPSESEGKNECDVLAGFTTFSNVLFDDDYDFDSSDDQSLSDEDIPAYYDDDDYNFAITPNETVESLIMGDEHLDTIPAMESDEFIKSCVENLVPNPSESEGENSCDLPACFTTLSNILFDAEYEFDSIDDQSLHNEDFPEEIFSNPLFEEEINSIRIGQHHFNVEFDLIGSLLNHDSSIIPSSSKIDSLLDEFAGELPLLKSIPPGIDEIDYHPENEIRLSQRLFNSFMEEIDLNFTPDDPMPPGIEEDDDDSKDILIREEFLDNYSLPLLENESFHFDIPLSSHPPAKPPDGEIS